MKIMKDMKGKHIKKFSALSNRIIGCAIEVHRHLGPGLLESTYQQCLAHELSINGIEFGNRTSLASRVQRYTIGLRLSIDLLVENEIILELKSVEKLLPIHEAQLLTYLKLAKVKARLPDQL